MSKTSTRIPPRRFSSDLSAAIQATGHEAFYRHLATFVGRVVRCERWLVMRYSRYAAPEFVFNNAMGDDAVEFYLRGLYRLDPLLRLVRSGKRAGVVVLSRLREYGLKRTYYDRIYYLSTIYDEAAILLPVPGGSSVAICLERASRRFSDQDIASLRSLVPLVQGMHDLHVERLFAFSPTTSALARREHSDSAVLIVDKDSRPIYRSRRWIALEKEGRTPPLARLKGTNDSEVQSVDGASVLHWEELPETFAIAPGGGIFMIETRSPGYISLNAHEVMKKFEDRFSLTSRERDIVDLVLQGFPNSMIARKLNLAAGTVRNYRYRLYAKLDITTERELFFLFVDYLLGRAVAPDGGRFEA